MNPITEIYRVTTKPNKAVHINPLPAAEENKSNIASKADKKLNRKKKEEIYEQLVKLLGRSVFDSYVQRIVAGIAAIPIEYYITPIFFGEKAVFDNYADAEGFLKKRHSGTDLESTIPLYHYGVTFSDGNLFERENLKSCDALDLHEAVGKVAEYFQDYHANK